MLILLTQVTSLLELGFVPHLVDLTSLRQERGKCAGSPSEMLACMLERTGLRDGQRVNRLFPQEYSKLQQCGYDAAALGVLSSGSFHDILQKFNQKNNAEKRAWMPLLCDDTYYRPYKFVGDLQTATMTTGFNLTISQSDLARVFVARGFAIACVFIDQTASVLNGFDAQGFIPRVDETKIWYFYAFVPRYYEALDGYLPKLLPADSPETCVFDGQATETVRGITFFYDTQIYDSPACGYRQKYVIEGILIGCRCPAETFDSGTMCIYQTCPGQQVFDASVGECRCPINTMEQRCYKNTCPAEAVPFNGRCLFEIPFMYCHKSSVGFALLGTSDCPSVNSAQDFTAAGIYSVDPDIFVAISISQRLNIAEYAAFCPTGTTWTYVSGRPQCVLYCPISQPGSMIVFSNTVPTPPSGICETSTGNYPTRISPTKRRVLRCAPAQYLEPISKTCYESCPKSFYVDSLTMMCVVKCPRRTVVSDGTCVNSCPDETQVTEENTCVESCPHAVFRGVCSPRCAPGYEFSPTSPGLCFPCSQYTNRKGQCVTDCVFIDQFNTGLCLDDCLYTVNGRCTDKCPKDYFLAGRTCEKQCPIYADVETQACVSKCEGKYIYGQLCTETCPEGTYINGFQCVNSCPPGTVSVGSLKKSSSVLQNTCFSLQYEDQTCPEFAFVLYNVLCVEECPAGFVFSGRRCLAQCQKGWHASASGECEEDAVDAPQTSGRIACRTVLYDSSVQAKKDADLLLSTLEISCPDTLSCADVSLETAFPELWKQIQETLLAQSFELKPQSASLFEKYVALPQRVSSCTAAASRETCQEMCSGKCIRVQRAGALKLRLETRTKDEDNVQEAENALPGFFCLRDSTV